VVARTIEYHRAQIREYLGFREAPVQDGNELVTWPAESAARRHTWSPVFFSTQRVLR
jgi:hypothetical protein